MSTSTLVNPAILTVPVVEAKDLATQQQVAWIHRLESCEDPTGNTTIRVLDTNYRYSYGILQFQMATWLRYGHDLGATEDNIYDPDLQERVALSMLNNGGEHNWFNCDRKIGPYPLSTD